MPDFIDQHFAVPFKFGANGGPALVVEQDSDDDIEQCIEAIVRTIRGQRLELPDFGIADPVLQEGGPDIGDISRAIEHWEPRAHTVIDVSDDSALDQLATIIHIGIEEVGE